MNNKELEEMIKMVDDDIREMHEIERENELKNTRYDDSRKAAKKAEKRRIVRKNNIKRMAISATLASAITLSAFGFIKNAYQQSKGESHLANEYYFALKEHNVEWFEGSSGYSFAIDGRNVSYEEAIRTLSEIGEECGYSDTESYIAVKAIFTPYAANDMVGEENAPSREEQAETKKAVYHEQCAKEYRGNAK